MREQNIQQAIRLHMSQGGIGTYFRANVGTAWTGDVEKLGKGDILIRNARPFSTGLPPGFSDLVGVTPLTITPDMVGKTIGVFTAVEVKTPRNGPSKEQARFITAIQRAGGHAGVARSPDEAERIARGELLL
jgi:hypothetical protein